jgi:hypothetical protein
VCVIVTAVFVVIHCLSHARERSVITDRHEMRDNVREVRVRFLIYNNKYNNLLFEDFFSSASSQLYCAANDGIDKTGAQLGEVLEKLAQFVEQSYNATIDKAIKGGNDCIDLDCWQIIYNIFSSKHHTKFERIGQISQ